MTEPLVIGPPPAPLRRRSSSDYGGKLPFSPAAKRKTWGAPALMEAYREGRLSSLRALTIAPVLSERTDEVGWALDVRDASVAFTAVPPPTAGAALLRFVGDAYQANGDPSEAAVTQRLRRAL